MVIKAKIKVDGVKFFDGKVNDFDGLKNVLSECEDKANGFNRKKKRS